MTATLLIGLGGIGREVLARVGAGGPGGPGGGARIAGVLVRGGRRREALAAVAGSGVEVGCALDEFGFTPDLCAECAGHGAVREWGPPVLSRGVDLLVASTGALADAGLMEALTRAASEGGARILLAAGAVAGTDALAAARVAGLDRVTYVSRKPPAAWRGTEAEGLCDLDALDGEHAFFEGPADEAARRFPQNANVAATVALAGAGFGATWVRLVADPGAPGNVHEVSAEGAFGSVRIEVTGRPLPDNPKTSALAAHSVAAAIGRRAAALRVGG